MKKSFLGVAFLASAVMAGAGCSGSGGGASSPSGGATSTVISGKVSAPSLQVQNALSNDNGAFAVALTDLEIYGLCFSNPPAIATADVAADGKFTISLGCAPGNSVSAIFRTKADGAEVGTIVFTDATKKDMYGNTKESKSITLTGDTDFGAITIGANGKISIPVSSIATAGSTTVAAATAFDFTGAWTIAAYDGTLPTGYVTSIACDMGTGVGCDKPGPPTGMDLTLIRYAGKEFTPATDGSCSVNNTTGVGTCAGTAGTDDAYVFQLWMGDASTVGSSSINSCSYKSGFTLGEARKQGHVDLTSSSVSVGGNPITLERVTFAVKAGFGGDTCAGQTGVLNCNKPWMKTGATSSWAIQDCATVTKTVSGVDYLFNACKVDNGDGTGVNYAAHLMSNGGGCVDSNGKALRVDNWNNTNTGCTNSTHASGLNQTTCTYVGQEPYAGAGNINYSCSHVGGTFSDAQLTTPSAQGYFYNPNQMVTIAAQGSNCKDITAANEIHRLRCYATSYSGGGGDDMDCGQRINLDWGATTPATFVIAEDRGKPKSNMITNIASYSADGSTAFVDDEEERTISINVAGSSQICKVAKTTKLSIKKLSDTKLLTDLTESGRLVTTDAACRAAASDLDTDGACKQNSPYSWLCEELHPNRWLFVLNKK